MAGNILVAGILTPPASQIKVIIGSAAYNAAMSQGVKRFVILEHSLSDSVHWDLMFDVGEALVTWQCKVNPLSQHWHSDTSLPLRRISDHRRAYLDYEGPVSADRGEVHRVEEGEYFPLVRRPELWTVQLAGRILVGTFLLSETGANDAGWRLQFLGR